MTVTIRKPGLFLAVLLAGACAPAVSTSTTPSQGALPRDAAALKAHCARTPAASRMQCYDTGLIGIMREQSIPAAMNVLEALSVIDDDVKREGHMYAHSMGLAAYTGPAAVSATFKQCLPAFQSGCYHGVIQAYFSAIAGTGGPEAVSNEAVNALCGDYRDTKEGDWLLFQCVHGMGHGLSQLSGHELKRTLAGCDKLQRPWEREGCYGGAFMENAMQAFSPHHGVGRPEAAADHSKMPGMDHSSMAGMDHGKPPAASAKLIDPGDPLYPCSSLTDKYLTSCYMMQTSVMLSLNHGDFADAARTCDRVKEDFRGVCYQSLGRDASSYTLGDFQKAARLCANGDPRYQPWCHTGFVKNVIDVTADYRSGVPYCRRLTRSEDTSACYRAIGEELAVLMADANARAAACAEVDPAGTDICAVAAGVQKREARER